MPRCALVSLTAVALALSACGRGIAELGIPVREDAGEWTDAGAEPDAGPPVDAGASDAGVADAGGDDAGLPGDSGAPLDAGPIDAGPADAGPSDAGLPDAGPPDAGPTDAGPPDAGQPDAGLPDAGPPDAGPADAGAPDAGQPDAGATDAGAPSCTNIVGDRATQVCLRWICDRQDLSEGSWSGSVASCSPGDMTAAARANALRVLNLYRFIAQLPPVADDSTQDAKTQACALMMDANNALDHTPPTSWTCYTAEGAEAAGNSNISTGQAVMSMDMYLADFGAGNAASIGHRRWVLSNSLGPVGIGSATGGSCLWVIGGSGSAGAAWTAWPAPGPFPIQALSASYQTVDSVGWTVQSDTINLAGAQVAVTDGVASLAMTVTQLDPWYGSRYAIRINPSGWQSQAGHTYQVSVTGIATPISYAVEVVDCR